MKTEYRISSIGLSRLEKYRDGLSLLSEVGSESGEIMNQDTSINALSIINCELNTNFDEQDFESDVKLFEITPSVTLKDLIKTCLIEKV